MAASRGARRGKPSWTCRVLIQDGSPDGRRDRGERGNNNGGAVVATTRWLLELLHEINPDTMCDTLLHVHEYEPEKKIIQDVELHLTHCE